MAGLKKILGYYKFKINNDLLDIVITLKLRNKILVGKGCKIDKDFTYGKDIILKDYVKIGANVMLGSNVIIGDCVKFSNIQISDNTHVDGHVETTGDGNGFIKIGQECYIGKYTILDWSDNIEIGDFVHIAGPSTALWTHTSRDMCFNSIPLKSSNRASYRPTSPIKIESNVYIGCNCTLYPGITVGHHSIIAPNSAVSGDVESYTMVGGVPARPIKRLDNSDSSIGDLIFNS